MTDVGKSILFTLSDVIEIRKELTLVYHWDLLYAIGHEIILLKPFVEGHQFTYVWGQGPHTYGHSARALAELYLIHRKTCILLSINTCQFSRITFLMWFASLIKITRDSSHVIKLCMWWNQREMLANPHNHVRHTWKWYLYKPNAQKQDFHVFFDRKTIKTVFCSKFVIGPFLAYFETFTFLCFLLIVIEQ